MDGAFATSGPGERIKVIRAGNKEGACTGRQRAAGEDATYYLTDALDDGEEHTVVRDRGVWVVWIGLALMYHLLLRESELLAEEKARIHKEYCLRKREDVYSFFPRGEQSVRWGESRGKGRTAW